MKHLSEFTNRSNRQYAGRYFAKPWVHSKPEETPVKSMAELLEEQRNLRYAHEHPVDK